MRIGKRELGHDKPVFIIAEVGSNFRTFSDCAHSIHMAAKAGADAVKFQFFTPKDLYGFDPPGVAEAPRIEESWLENLRGACDAAGVEFMCTGFSPDGYRILDHYVLAHKIASAEATCPFIRETARLTGKPILISTGAFVSPGEIIQVSREFSPEQAAFLYCRASYPAHDILPSEISALGRTLWDRFTVGLSDHSLSVFPPRVPIIEKHVNICGVDSPDSGHSLAFEDFKAMCRYLRGLSVVQGVPVDMLMKHRRRLIATKDIAPGETLTFGVNFGSFRSLKDEAHAYQSSLALEITGMPAKRAIAQGDGIGPGDV